MVPQVLYRFPRRVVSRREATTPNEKLEVARGGFGRLPMVQEAVDDQLNALGRSDRREGGATCDAGCGPGVAAGPRTGAGAGSRRSMDTSSLSTTPAAFGRRIIAVCVLTCTTR